MDQSFIHRYRPKRFSEFDVETDVIRLLEHMTSTHNVSALLLGPAGSGKTTLTDIVSNEYYAGIGPDGVSDNVMTISNLKDQGIHFYRETVTSFCRTTCTISGKKKTIIVIDIDTINEQSQQVLRSCIDSYKKNINFVVTGTVSKKIIDSLQSRLVVIKVPPPSSDILRKITHNIIAHEEIVMDDDSVEFILRICNGSTKLVVNYLEKFALLKRPIDTAVVNATCTNIYFDRLEHYTAVSVHEHNLAEAIRLIYAIHDEGYSVMDILDSYFSYVKQSDMPDDLKYRIIKIICKYIAMFNLVHEHDIELIFLTKELVTVNMTPERS